MRRPWEVTNEEAAQETEELRERTEAADRAEHPLLFEILTRIKKEDSGTN